MITGPGTDGNFMFWTGVVEDRDDPLKLGRVRVRIFGYNNEKIADQPVGRLNWAQVLLPVTSAGINGIGQTPLGLVEGSWVFGFFRDGKNAQDPVVLGSFAGVSTPLDNDRSLGFRDQRTYTSGATRTQKSLKESPRKLASRITKTDGTGTFFVEENGGAGEADGTPQPQADGWIVTGYPRYELLYSPDLNALARNDGGTTDVLTVKDSAKSINIDVASALTGSSFTLNYPSTLECIDPVGVAESASEEGNVCLPEAVETVVSQIKTSYKSTDTFPGGAKWSEPSSQYFPIYPFNHVYESESGTIIEIDDTPGVERYHLFHRTGSFYEIHPDGTTISKSINDDYTIIKRTAYKHIEGRNYETIDQGYKILVNRDKTDESFDIVVDSGGSYNLEVKNGFLNLHVKSGCLNISVGEGDASVLVNNGDYNVSSNNGNVNIYSKQNISIQAEQNCTVKAGGDLRAKVDGTACIDVTGDMTAKVGGDLLVQVGGACEITSVGQMTLTSATRILMEAPRIDLNPGN